MAGTPRTSHLYKANQKWNSTCFLLLLLFFFYHMGRCFMLEHNSTLTIQYPLACLCVGGRLACGVPAMH